MLRRRVLAPAAALLAALALAACVPGGGEPTPTPTELTEEQAYASAEEAFRAYIEAVNAIDVADPSTFEPAFALTTGRLNAADRQKYSGWHAEGWIQQGELVVQSADPLRFDLDETAVSLGVCLDASAVTLVDSSGTSQVDPGRPNVAPLDVSVILDASAQQWLVQEIVLDATEIAC